MKITSVRSFLLSYPLPEPLKLEFHGGERTIVKRDAMLIRVETDGGLVGYAPGPASEYAHGVVSNIVAPFLRDRVRDRIRLYGSAGMYMPPEAYAAEAAAVADLGFRAYKMRSAMGPDQD